MVSPPVWYGLHWLGFLGNYCAYWYGHDYGWNRWVLVAHVVSTLFQLSPMLREWLVK